MEGRGLEVVLAAAEGRAAAPCVNQTAARTVGRRSAEAARQQCSSVDVDGLEAELLSCGLRREAWRRGESASGVRGGGIRRPVEAAAAARHQFRGAANHLPASAVSGCVFRVFRESPRAELCAWALGLG